MGVDQRHNDNDIVEEREKKNNVNDNDIEIQKKKQCQ